MKREIKSETQLKSSLKVHDIMHQVHVAIKVWHEQKGPVVVCGRDGAPWDPLTTSAALPPDTSNVTEFLHLKSPLYKQR